jgi:UDP-N-acetylmuramyl pentapeptide phosphotransferase/UDP-N-acetylglucosamine-1-phosphate transferase
VPDPRALHGLAVPVAVVGAVALMNACNFLDNMDGILGGIAVVCAIGLAVLAPPASAPAHGALALAGAAAGFLAYNFAPARIFLGDAGSLPVGYLLAAFGLALASGSLHGGPEVGTLLGLALVVGYPLFDLTFVTVTRLADGRRPWDPGHDHSTHRLNRLLHDPRRTALVVYALTFLLAAAGVAVAHASAGPSWALAILSLLFLVALGLRLARVPAA